MQVMNLPDKEPNVKRWKGVSVFFSFFALLLVLGDIAQDRLELTHFEMGSKQCGGKDNIVHYDTKTFTCKNVKG